MLVDKTVLKRTVAYMSSLGVQGGGSLVWDSFSNYSLSTCFHTIHGNQMPYRPMVAINPTTFIISLGFNPDMQHKFRAFKFRQCSKMFHHKHGRSLTANVLALYGIIKKNNTQSLLVLVLRAYSYKYPIQ